MKKRIANIQLLILHLINLMVRILRYHITRVCK